MERCYFDTSVLVSAAVAQHPHHEPAFNRLKEVAAQNHQGYVSAHGLAEFYSVLSRAPFKPPLHPSEVWKLAEGLILAHLELVTLTAKDYVELTRNCAQEGWTGGRIHDAIHVRCAQKVNSSRIYTFNLKDFRMLAPPELQRLVMAP